MSPYTSFAILFLEAMFYFMYFLLIVTGLSWMYANQYQDGRIIPEEQRIKNRKQGQLYLGIGISLSIVSIPLFIFINKKLKVRV
jgi:hypothetical protein